MRLLIIVTISVNMIALNAKAEDFYFGASIGVSQFDGIADADANRFGDFTTVPDELSVNGLPFESTETSWSVYAGRHIKSWVALEIGFSDLGDSGRENRAFNTPDGTILNSGVSLNAEELYLGARFSTSLSPKITADWMIGLTRSSFDAGGFLPVLTGTGFSDAMIERVPFASPGDETGLIWGFGFNWKLDERFALGIDYRQHNTQVLDIDSLALGVVVSM